MKRLPSSDDPVPLPPQNLENRRSLSLIDILSIGAGVAGCSGAVLAAKNAAMIDAVMAWLVGLTLGLVCFLAMRRLLGKRMLQRVSLLESRFPRLQVILGYFLLLAAALWIVVAALIGSWIVKWLVRVLE
jgi:hypothetical protein